MEYFYHYTTVDNWKKIQKEGLQPQRSIVVSPQADTPDVAQKPVLWGLPSPAPENWLAHTDGYYSSVALCLLDIIAEREDYRGGGGMAPRNNIVLLKIRCLPSDDLRAGDYKSLWEGNSYNEDGLKYCDSIVRLQGNFNFASMKLPEVLCFNSIPAERIEFIKEIPAATMREIRDYVDAERIKVQNIITPPLLAQKLKRGP